MGSENAQNTAESQTPFLSRLKEALEGRKEYIERNEIPKLKDELKNFNFALNVIYQLFGAKGYITEDPYKNDIKMNEIQLPENTPLTDNNKRDQLGRRLSHLDNQFDFLCNFFPLNIDSLNQETIKQIMALLRFVEWNRLTPDSKSPTTAAISSIVIMARKASSMDTTQSLRFNDSLQMLEGSTEKIAFLLKNISDYNREYYKFNVRSTITNGMTREEEQTAAIKAKFDSLMPGAPFYRELIEEIIKEDFDDNAPAIQAALFKRLTADVEKEKGLKKTVVLKPVLIQGLNALGSAATTIAEIMIKTQENHELIQSRKKGLLKKIAALFTQFTNKENDGAMYIFDTFDTLKNTVQKTELHYASFMAETERKNKILAAMAPQGMAAIKLKTMDESQLTALLKKNLRDVLALHKMFCGLDDYFKRAAPGEVRSRIKGIKPELSALKNAHAQANQKLIAYEQERENAEQYKKLGVRMVHV